MLQLQWKLHQKTTAHPGPWLFPSAGEAVCVYRGTLLTACAIVPHPGINGSAEMALEMGSFSFWECHLGKCLENVCFLCLFSPQ